MRKASRIIIWTIVVLLFVGTFVYLFSILVKKCKL